MPFLVENGAPLLDLKRKTTPSRPFPFDPAALEEPPASAKPSPHVRIWDLHSSLHCSIVGTCLTTAELRQVLRRAGLPDVDRCSDHDLHRRTVALCSKRDTASKLLQKALDRKHRGVINLFGRAKTKAEVEALWADFLKKGDVGGAYWAAMTHLCADEKLVHDIFGDVHMLSHLLGAANRADIGRLRDLEKENHALNEKVQRQQSRLRDAIVERDRTIGSLKEALTAALARTGQAGPLAAAVGDTAQIVADLDRKTKLLMVRAASLEARLSAAQAEIIRWQKLSGAFERKAQELSAELAHAETILASKTDGETSAKRRAHLAGATLLYVGGRPHQIPQLKKLAEEFGADLLHHDGGIEDCSGALQGLIGQADAVLFPVDCVSHTATAVLKRACRQLGKTYFPLRSSGLTSFAGVMQRIGAG
jgi:hypothetical protein